MTFSHKWISILLALILLNLVFILFGALPAWLTPDGLQEFMLTGFAESLKNNTFLDPFVHNSGYPLANPIAIGFSGVIVTSFLLKTGMYAPDAYAVVNMMYLSLAFWGAYKVAKIITNEVIISLLAAFLWFSAPMIWWHTGYAALALGMALLPFYFYCTIQLWNISQLKVSAVFLFASACLISIFMDGYSFIMYWTGAAIIAFFSCIHKDDYGKKDIRNRILIHIASFLFAYILYALYLGKSSWYPLSLDSFRAYGMDLTYLFIPTKGVHALWDWMGISIVRDSKTLYGDASVWSTTFFGLMIIACIFGAVKSKQKFRLAFIIIALVGLYLALGPSVKLFSTKLSGHSSFMPESYALFPSGTSILSSYLPGFKMMRASYRWACLGWFGIWGLIILTVRLPAFSKRRILSYIFLILLAITNLPEPVDHVKQKMSFRDDFKLLDKSLVHPLQQYLSSGDRVAFLPVGNDFGLCYIAATLKLLAYNIGGDKHVSVAARAWPKWFRDLYNTGKIGDEKIIIRAFERDQTDAVVLIYFNPLQDFYSFHTAKPRVEMRENAKYVLEALKKDNNFEIFDSEWFSVIRLKKNHNLIIIKKFSENTNYSIYGHEIKFNDDLDYTPIKSTLGLSSIESWGRWSDANRSPSVKLELHRPLTGKIRLKIIARALQNQSLTIDIGGIKQTIAIERFKDKEFSLDYNLESPTSIIELTPSDPQSPKNLRMNDDTRVLGVGLVSIVFEQLSD